MNNVGWDDPVIRFYTNTAIIREDYLPSEGSHKVLEIHKTDQTQKQLLDTKNKERRSIFDTTKNALTSMSYINDRTKELTLQNLQQGDFINRKIRDQMKVARNDLKYEVETGTLELIKGFLKAEKGSEIEHLLLPLLNNDSEAANNLSNKLLEETASFRQPDIALGYANSLKEFSDSLQRVVHGKVPLGDEIREANEDVLEILRHAFQSEAYLHLKEDESNGYIKTFHELNLKLYQETALLDAYEGFGSHCMENVGVKDLDEIKTDTRVNRLAFEGKMKEAWTALKDQNDVLLVAFGDRRNLEINWHSAFKSLKSSWGYDPRVEGENNAGVFYQETVTLKGDKTGKIVNVLTPSPTLGGEVSPEYRAGLQAIQNQRLHPEIGGDRPGGWVYVNHQDIKEDIILKGGERDRSKAIMRLNDEFPFSFKGITVTKDSAFYQGGIKEKHHDVDWSGIKQKKITDAYSYAENFDELLSTMQKELLNPNNFNLEGSHEGAGFYFPGTPEEWREDFLKIMDETKGMMVEILIENGITDLNAQEIWELEALAKDFVHSSLSKLVEAKMLNELAKSSDNPKILLTQACKENIDRGGAENAKTLWAIGGEIKSVLGCFFSRAAMGRFRAILANRCQHFRSCIKWCPQKVFQAHLGNILSHHDIVSNGVKTVHKKAV